MHVGQRILLGGIDRGLCQRHVNFNGRPRSALLKPVNGIGTGSDWLRAQRTGTVEGRRLPTDVRPGALTQGVSAAFRSLGIDHCDHHAAADTSSRSPVVSTRTRSRWLRRSEAVARLGRMLVANVQLATVRAAWSRRRSESTSIDGDGDPCSQCRRTRRGRHRSPSRSAQGSPLVIALGWLESFCGDDFPYSVTVSLPRPGAVGPLDEMSTSPVARPSYDDPPPRPPRAPLPFGASLSAVSQALHSGTHIDG